MDALDITSGKCWLFSLVPIARVLEQHWDVVQPLSDKADLVAYHYYVGLLKISEDKVRASEHTIGCKTREPSVKWCYLLVKFLLQDMNARMFTVRLPLALSLPGVLSTSGIASMVVTFCM